MVWLVSERIGSHAVVCGSWITIIVFLPFFHIVITEMFGIRNMSGYHGLGGTLLCMGFVSHRVDRILNTLSVDGRQSLSL